MWQAETRDGYGYYELILNSANVGIGDLIGWSATDDIISNTTNHTITESDLDRGGVFGVNLTLPSAPPISEPSAILVIYGNVPYKNGTPCDSPFVVVTNSNTSEELIADNRTGESFYQLATSSAFAEAGDVLKVNASKNGTPVGDVTHIVNRTEIEQGAIEVNLNQGLVDAPDFIVTDISFNPSEPLIGDLVAINATILNAGAEGETYVEFYDNKSILLAGKDSIITLPDALMIWVHFYVFSGNITIYNETGVVERLIGEKPEQDYWTKWCDGGTIRIELESQNAWFVVDRYEALLANKSITLGRGNSTNVSAVWNLSDQYMGWATNGTHDITVRVDPYNQVIESDETNNNRTETIDVNPSLDFAVTNISFSNNAPVLGDVVEINATIRNYGVGSGTTVVKFSYDNISTKNVPLANKTVTLNGTESKVVSASWQTGAYGGARDHDITVMVDPDDTLVETNETNNTLHKQAFVNGTDLTVTAISCGFYPDRCYVGQDVPVNITIANIGAVDATNFTVEFRDGTCPDYDVENTSGVIFNETRIERLKSGESRNVSVIWNPAETGWHTINASIPYDVLTDNNETNNKLVEYAEVEPFYDFVVENVSVPQRGVRRGESVNITATIGSSSKAHGGGNVSIAFFVNSTDYAGTWGERFTRIGTIDCVYVKVNETETVSITWDVDVAGGCHLIVAVANPDGEVDEIEGITPHGEGILFRGGDDDTGNNVKNCTLYVNPLDLDIINIALVPAELNIGDVVNISAEIRNNGSAEANSMVRFYMEKTYSQSLILQTEDVLMRVHFDHIKVKSGGKVNASVTDSGGDDRPVHFYVKCEECGGQDMEVRRIKFEETDCYYEIESDGYWYWDDVWTEWTTGTAIKINAEGGAILSIDKYQVLLGNSTVTLGPGESMNYHSTWNASPPIKAGEYYRFMANVEDHNESKETYIGGTDLAVTNITVKPAVYDGDRVWVNATIGNLGRINATDFIVNFTEVYTAETYSHCGIRPQKMQFITSIRVSGLEAGNATTISVPWNVRVKEAVFVMSGGGLHIEIADDYTIEVTINPLESTEKEENDANNSDTSENVHVYKSRDFKITNISFRVNNRLREPSELLIHSDVIINTTLNITNLANQGGSVNVSFYIDEVCDEHEIGNTTAAFPVGGGTGYAEIEWKVESFADVDITSEHNITVVVDPDNMIYEIDGDRNNTYAQPINVMASDLLVESLEFHPESPMWGKTASISVTLANHGDAEARNVNLTIYDWAERHIEDEDLESGMGRDQIEITKEAATAMRLYLDLEIDGGRVSINDGSRREIIHYDGNRTFHGWTPWVMDNSTTVVVTDGAYARVSRVYYLASSNIIDTSTHDLEVSGTENITVDWNPPTVGERFVAAIIDPEDRITEHDEVNNRLTEFISVQTADILVSNLSLAWLNGTEIGKDEIIKDGDTVRISANLTNIGVEDAGSFNVSFFVDDLLITNEVMGGLAQDESICVSTDWGATVGNNLLKVEADYGNEIDETNETNNIMARKRYICGANLSGNTLWETMGLHGRILFEPDQPYDEDEVVITAIVNNSGYIPAENFSAALFFGHAPYTYPKRGRYGWGWINKSYDDAVCIYLNIDVSSGYEIFAIYDGNDTEVKRVDRSCWVRVQGDTVSVAFLVRQQSSSYTIDFYPVYPDNLSQILKLDVNSSIKLPPIQQNVSAGDYPVVLFIDPENKVPEDEDYREDNTISRIMHVKPTRDFTVTNVTASCANLSDLDTPTIIANVSNIGLRNGTAEVDFVDYEVESRRYGYHFDKSLNPPYLPIEPDVKLLNPEYQEVMIIHRPGVDAIELHFERIMLYPPQMETPQLGRISICNESRKIWGAKAGSKDTWGGHGLVIRVSGETAYIYIVHGFFDLDRYTTETEFHREEVWLNASKTWNKSKNVTSIRTAYTGDHTVVVTLDRDDGIAEINESNNANSNLFHVNASRDPAIVGINITPENPGDGDNVDITAIVENNGYENASFTVDLWANLIRNKPRADESLPDSNLTTNIGGDRIRYITFLQRANVTLAPGENTTVNATWCDISIDGSPEHHIIAIVDPTDEIDEINESNNEIVNKITPDCPDLTIGTDHVPGGGVKPVVPINEIGGASGASNVTVRFESSETEELKPEKSVHGWDDCSISHRGAFNMQVLFDPLSADPKKKKGYVIVNDRRSSRNYIKKYRGVEYAEVWSPWVEGDKVWIISGGAGTAYAKITEYRWGNVSDAEQFDLSAGDSEHVKIPWTEYREPYDLNVTVDPDNNITELNEDNNNKTIRMGADIAVMYEDVVVDPYAPIMGDTCYITGIENIGNLPTGEFNVALYINATNETAFEYNATINETISLAPDEEYIFSWETPEVEPPEDIDYDIRIVADPEDVVKELDEDNNEASTDEPLTVYSHTNYTGGELCLYDTDWVYGNINYTIGDRPYSGGTWDNYEVNFEGVIPENIKEKDIKLTRLYLYWTWGKVYSINESKFVPVPIEVNVKFNNGWISEDRKYIDCPHATKEVSDVAWGTYAYDIQLDAVKPDNSVIVDRHPFKDKYESDPWYVAPQPFGIYGVGLLVIYGSDCGVLTNYWICEGGDVIYEGANNLGIEDMVTTAVFEGKVEDRDMTNATLWTVTPGGNDENELYFNRMSWENVWSGALGVDHRCVTEHLIARDNTAKLQYISGNSMMSSGAFLFLRYPPDLNIIDLTAPAYTVVGAHHSINATIRNDGRSDAHDFNVTFYIDRKQMVRIPHLDLAAGENMTIHLYNWTPMMLMHSYNLTAAVDVLSGEDWTEVETDNNVLTKHVVIEEGGFGNETGSRGTGGGSNPTGGEYTEPITGWVMEGVTFSTLGGGGGPGMFSPTEWIMKGAVWFVLVLFVYAGYRVEQRSYGRVRAGLRQPY